MTTIWKYVLDISGRPSPEVKVPGGRDARLLDVQFQEVHESGPDYSIHSAHLCAWFLLDPNAEPEPRRFKVLVTGDNPEEVLPADTHVATVQRSGYVLHIFEGL